jgi:predicted small lipoprotein YifL
LSTLLKRSSLIAVALLALAGCGDSDPLPEESAGEAYVQQRLEHLHPDRASYEIDG